MRRTCAQLTLAAPLVLLLSAATASAQEIPWDRSRIISRTSSGEDIRTVLRSFAQSGGFNVVFAPEVGGTVSFRLERVPLPIAFDQIIEENGLTYTYSAPTRTLDIAALVGGGQIGSTTFIPLDQVTYGEVSQAMTNLGVPAQGVRYDPGSRTVAVTGDAARVQQITNLVNTLETARERQRTRVGEAREREVEIRQAELAQRAYADLARFEVKVVPLRFTDVGPTQKTFQGRVVTIPGIEDTLKSILGLEPPPAGPATDGAGADPAALLGRAQALGFPRISIDQRTNAVVIHGTPEAIAAIEQIIRELDRPLQMVEIEVVIATAEVGVARELGINWRGSGTEASGDPRSVAVDTGTTGGVVGNPPLGGDLFNSNGLNALSLLPEAATAGSTVASFVVRGAEGILQAQLQALATDDRARVLSAPRLVTLDNITARITRSQNIYVQVDTRGENGGGLGAVGLQEIQTGLTLEITPSIVPSQTDARQGFVRLNLRAENSAPGAGVFGQIDVRSQEVQTNVLVPDGATFVIGGLFDDAQLATEAGIPGLKDIPLLGTLFKNTNTTKSLGETIFFITPRVIDERAVVENDIAVKVGSEEYIRRERRALSEVYDSFNAPSAAAAPRPLSALEEDE
jgi:type III secretion system YscC/HrcC family outer membrane pore protein